MHLLFARYINKYYNCAVQFHQLEKKNFHSILIIVAQLTKLVNNKLEKTLINIIEFEKTKINIFIHYHYFLDFISINKNYIFILGYSLIP